jgi:hypothetical protein
MTYTLLRGSRMLGRIEMRDDAKALSGLLIPEVADADLRGEVQIHFMALGVAEAFVATMPMGPELPDGPAQSNRSSGALEPVRDDQKVKPEDELHVYEDERDLAVRQIWLQETRYLHEVPDDARRQLPPGALRGNSYWGVTVFRDPHSNELRDIDSSFDGDASEEISP